MKKLVLSLLGLFLLFSCAWDNLVTEQMLKNNYDSESGELDLSNFALSKIPDFSSYWKDSLFFQAKSVNLSNNNIVFLETDKLWDFTNLWTLSIANNTLKAVQNTDVQLESLDISGNQLEVLIFASGSTIKELNISDNVLRYWSDIQLPLNLEVLNVNNNKLNDIKGFGELLQLRYLDLSENELSDLNMKELSKQKKLEYIDISWNLEMSPERVEAMTKYNTKYLEKQNEQNTITAGGTWALTQ